jgi:hypothetical protein
MAKVRLPDGRVGELSRGETVNVRLVDGRVGELSLELISPAKARRWLANTPQSRWPRRKSCRQKVTVYGNLVRQGRWPATDRVVIHGGLVVRGHRALSGVIVGGSCEMQVLRVPVKGSSHPELR